MQVIDFTVAHVEQATQIALQNYEEERGFVSALPQVDETGVVRRIDENAIIIYRSFS